MFSYIVGAVPFPDDPPPQASALGGLADTCDSSAGLGKYGAMPQTTRTQPPNSGIFNLRSVRNLGKNVALAALLINRGTLALEAEGISIPPLPLTSFPEKILQPDSYLKQLREGKIKAPSYQVYPER